MKEIATSSIEIVPWTTETKKRKYESSKLEVKEKNDESEKSAAHSSFASVMRQEFAIEDLWGLIYGNLDKRPRRSRSKNQMAKKNVKPCKACRSVKTIRQIKDQNSLSSKLDIQFNLFPIFDQFHSLQGQ